VEIAWFRGDPDQGGVLIGIESDLGAMGAGQSLGISTTWNSAGVSGPQQFFAVLDHADAIDELNEDDNRQSLAVDFGALPAVPDAVLLRENFSLSPVAVTVYPAAVTLTGTLTNAGGAALSNVPVALFSIRNGLRTEIARQALNVAAQAETPVSFQFTLQRGDPLQLALVADPDNSVAEIRESNNALLFELSSSSGIDLAIGAADIVQLTQPAVSGQPVRFRVTAHNDGATASPSFVMQAQVRQGVQTHVLGDITMQLDAGAISERELLWTPTALGTASLEVVLDPFSSIGNELDRSNNSAALAFEVVDPSAPNLLVRPQSIQMSPNLLDQSRPANLRALIANIGASITGSYVVAVSSGGASGPRVELARVTVDGGLASGAESEVNVPLPALATSGDRYFFVTVDPDLQIAELNDSDNTGFILQHVRSIADASVTIASVQLTPSIPVPGQELRAVISIRNLGDQPLSGLVARLFAGTPQDGTVIPSDQIATDIAGGQTTQLSWTWVYATPSGTPALSIQLDPGNLIAELREDNNVAVVPLQILADHYATEPYISPNDDGVKESTQVVFRQLASTPAVIDVRDFGDSVVRTYTPEEFIGGNGWAVLWNGRDDNGGVVYDGRYRVQASATNGDLLGEVAVVVDTNRSSILEAVGTGLEKYTELVHSYDGLRMALPPVAYPDQDTVLLVDPLNPATADPLDRLSGIYRYDVLLQTLDAVIDGNWMLAQGANVGLAALHWADGGHYAVFVLRANNQDSVWKVHVLLWNSEQPTLARRYRLDTGAETVLQSAGVSGSVKRVFNDGMLISNDRRALYFISFDPARAANTVLDIQGPGVIAHLGEQGALVHLIQGNRDLLEWRNLRSADRRIVLDMQLSAEMLEHRRCLISPEDSWGFGGELLVHNHGARNVVMVHADTGEQREIALPLVDPVSGYVPEFDVNTGEGGIRRAVAVGIGRDRECGARVSAVAGLHPDEAGKSAASSAAKLNLDAVKDRPAPRFALLFDGAVVRIRDTENEFEHYVAGAQSAYILERENGRVTYLGSFSSWPMSDPRDAQTFPSHIQENYVNLGSAASHLVAEYESRAADSPPYVALADGSGIAYPVEGASAPGYPVFLPGGYFSGARFSNPNRLIGTWPSESHLFGTSATTPDALSFYSSLANQTTRLRARGNANGIDLLGIASDKNFRQFELEWANFATPDQWNAIGPAIQEPIVDGEFMSWAPPAPGQFLIRLTTEDAAGNRRSVSTRALSPAGADIANTQLSSRYISPNGDGIKDALGVSLNVVRPTTLRFSIRNASSAIVHTYQQQVSDTGPFNWAWDGRLGTGQIAADGKYRISINDWFSAGFTLDNTPPTPGLSRSIIGARPEKPMQVAYSRAFFRLDWNTQEINPATLVLERADASAPIHWMPLADNLPADGGRIDPGSDTGSYRLVAEDRAGNRVVSPATGFAPDDFALVGRWVWSDPQTTQPWGCAAEEHDPYGCLYAQTFGSPLPAIRFRGAEPYPIESEAPFALDLYLAAGTPRGSISLHYRVDAFGSNATPNAPWQPLLVAASELDGAKLRVSAVAPTLPLGSLITVQAATDLNTGSLLYSEQSAFRYTGISPPITYLTGDRCSPEGVEEGLPPPAAPADWACFEEQLQGLAMSPTLTVIGNAGQVIAVQSPVRNVDGVVLFEIPDSRCKELIARATSRSGRTYEARRLCESGDIVSFLGVYPAIDSSCDAVPRHRIRAQAAFVSQTEVEVTRIQAYFQPENQPRRMVIDVVNPPDLDIDCARSSACLAQHGLVNEIDVSDLVDGRYAMSFEATLSTGDPIRHARYFFVDRTPALFDIRMPREGHRECSTGSLVVAANGGGAWKMEFPMAATVSDPSGVAAPIVRVGPIPPASTINWNAPAPGDWNLYRVNTEGALADVTLHVPTPLAVTYEAGTGAVGGSIVGPMTGPVSAQFAAINWSGALQCRVINFSSDIGIEVDADFAPATTFLNGLQSVAVINPIGENRYQSAELLLRVEEPVTARIELWRGVTASAATRIAELHSEAAYGEGTHSIIWNGRDGNAQPLADDSYWLKIFASDDCGHEKELSKGVIVDTTAPIVRFDSPDAGAVISDLLVRIEGSASDASNGSYVLTAESADSITIANGSTVSPNDGAPFGHNWNRGEITGPVILRTTATDIVGNRSVADLPIQLAPRQSHLFDDAALVPEVFSPNADGHFDRINIRYALAARADVTVRVLHADGAVVAVLQNAEPKLAGNHTLQWHGTDIPTTGADGRYRLELRAVNAQSPDQFEIVDLFVMVDVSPPRLTLLAPDGEFSKGEGPVSVAIADPHFESATWQLGDRQGEVVTVGASSLLELSEINEGVHGFVLNAVDSVANSARLERSLIIDRTIPNALISIPEEHAVLGGAATQATIEGVASDAHFSRYILRIASAADPTNPSILVESNTSVASGNLYALALSRPDGEYLLRLNVEDKAGHIAQAERRFHIDHTAPTAQLIEPADNAYVQRRLRVMGTASDVHLADYRLRIATPEQASLGMWSDLLVEHRSVNAAELGVIDLTVPDGDYFLELLARDKVQQTASSRIRIRLDPTPPLAPLELVAHRQGAQDVALAWNDVPASDFAGYRLYRDGVRLNTVLTPGRSYLDTAVPNGRLRYEVSAMDLAGNESARSNPAEVTIDRESPEVSLLAPQNGTSVSGLVDIVGTAFSESDFDRYRLSLLDAATQTLVEVLAESNASVRGSTLANWDTVAAAPGAYRLLLEAWDRNSNRAEVASDVIVDNLPPAAPSGLTAMDLAGDGQISWDTNSEPDLLGYVLLRDGSAVNGGASLPEDLRVLAIATNSYLDQALVDGPHTWIVFAIDTAGNLSAPSAPTQLTISRRQPDVRIVAPIHDFRFAESVRVLATSDDQDIAQVWFEFRAEGAAGWTALGAPVMQSPYAITWTPGAIALGHYEIRALIRDTNGLEDAAPPVVRVHYDDLEPPVQVIGVAAHANGGDIVVSWNGQDAPDLLSYRVERSGQASSEFQLVAEVPAGTTTLVDSDQTDGTLYYRVTAVDASGNAGVPSMSDSAQVFSLSVDAPFSPTRALSTPLTGSTPLAGTLRVSRDSGGAVMELLQIEVGQYGFSIPDVALVAGENRLLLSVTDAESNISRAASAWATVGGDPSIPTGLAVTVHNHHVTASWNANSEPDIAGYRLFRNDFPALVERDLDDLIAVGSPDDSASGALDGDPQTAWLANSHFEAGPLQHVALELQSTAVRQISGLQFTWQDGRRPLSLDILAHSGRDWIRLMSISDVEAQQTLRFAEPYRTDRLMIVPTSASSGQTIALEQILIAEQPLIAANEFVDHVIEGSYAYTLSAINTLGFESARSTSVNAEVGTSTPPAPVVLSGLVQGHDTQLSWTSSATIGVANYRLLRNGVQHALIDASLTQFTDAGLANGSYTYSVIALDRFGDASVASNTVTLTIAVSRHLSREAHSTSNGSRAQASHPCATQCVAHCRHPVRLSLCRKLHRRNCSMRRW
jgi:flagellar hook assembly protein FlgD